jgi:hypothetical protein
LNLRLLIAHEVRDSRLDDDDVIDENTCDLFYSEDYEFNNNEKHLNDLNYLANEIKLKNTPFDINEPAKNKNYNFNNLRLYSKNYNEKEVHTFTMITTVGRYGLDKCVYNTAVNAIVKLMQYKSYYLSNEYFSVKTINVGKKEGFDIVTMLNNNLFHAVQK